MLRFFLASLPVCLLWVPVCTSETDDEAPRGLQVIDGDDEKALQKFISKYSDARGAVAVARLAAGSKRHKFLEEVASDHALYELVVLGVRFGKGASSLTMYRDGEAPEVFSGRWTRPEMREWLARTAFPLVASLQNTFRAKKYVEDSPFGVVFVLQRNMKRNGTLAQALTPFARQYHDKLKFTFFSDRSAGLKDICMRFGILTSDELVIVEQPSKSSNGLGHRNDPPLPKYRLAGMTPERIEDFFYAYGNRTLPMYYRGQTDSTRTVVKDGIRELSASDFSSTVNDPESSVLVLFVSGGCVACNQFSEGPYVELAKKAQDEVRRNPRSYFKHLVVAKINQTNNEHPELVEGTPCLRIWPRGKRKWPEEIVIHGRADAQPYFDQIDRHLSDDWENTEL